MPYLGKSPSQGVRTRFQFTPNAGTTSISGADANGLTLSFTDGNYVDVYLNGVMLKAGVDYNTNTANTIAGLSATVASDVVDIVVYDTFSLFGGTLEGNVKVNNGTFNVTGAGDFDSTLNVDGVVTANAGVVVDNITIDGTEIDLSSGNLTIDVANDIILDSGDGDIQLKDTGSTFLNIYESSDHAYLYNPRSNGDIIFQGNGVSEALRIDMSDAGAATFNSTVIAPTMTLSRSSSNSPNVEPVLLFDNIDSVIGANENIGSIRFTTSAEASGSDANLESGRIACFSESGHGSATNASALAFYTASSEAASSNERMRINSSGNVMIGTTTEGVDTGENFTIADAAHCGMTIRSGNSSNGNIYFSDGTSGTSEYMGLIRYNHVSNYMLFSVNNNERMRIDSSGRVTKPYQPVFSAYRDSSAAEGLTGTIVFNATRSNVGSHYNTSTGKFTAPVTGNYQFNLVALGATSGGAALNGEAVYATLYHETDSANLVRSYVSGQSGYPNLSFSTTQPLDANDVVRIDVGGAGVYSDGADIWLVFSGFLIG